MVDKVKEFLVEFKQKNSELILDNKRNKDSIEDRYSGLYVFISFDLVNSTQYKSIEHNWVNLIDYFYDQTAKELNTYASTKIFNVWKYIGDEVLFFGKVKDSDELINIPQDVTKVLNKVSRKIYESFEESEGLLGIKATIWCAHITQFQEGMATEKKENYLLEKRNINTYEVSTKLPTTVYDFLGPEIDAGFRLAKQCARKNQLVVSAELTFLILNCINEKNDEEMKIVLSKKFRTMELLELKGIWHSRKYPVIWYREQWELGVFEYDQSEDEYSFYKEKYINTQEGNFNNYKFLENIMDSVGRSKVVLNKYLKSIGSSSEDGLLETHRLLINNPVEVHLVAIIFDENGKVLLLERGEEKSNTGRFDFGCANLKYNSSIKESLLDYYCELLNVDSNNLDILVDSQGDAKPVSTYTHTKATGDQNTVSGFIFTAKINGEFQLIEATLNKNEYSSYQVKGVEEINLGNINMYKDSLENIMLSQNMWKDSEKIHNELVRYNRNLPMVN